MNQFKVCLCLTVSPATDNRHVLPFKLKYFIRNCILTASAIDWYVCVCDYKFTLLVIVCSCTYRWSEIPTGSGLARPKIPVALWDAAQFGSLLVNVPSLYETKMQND